MKIILDKMGNFYLKIEDNIQEIINYHNLYVENTIEYCHKKKFIFSNLVFTDSLYDLKHEADNFRIKENEKLNSILINLILG
jgi:hypothetical protein